MLTILLLLSVLKSSFSTPVLIPTDGTNNASVVLLGHELPEYMNIARFRTLQEIIWSCLATIFACTWVAVHPNLPGPYDCEWTKLKRKVMVMVYAILAPEMITMWAMGQWYFSREIMKEFNKKNEGSEGGLSRWITIKKALRVWFHNGPRQSQSTEWTLTHGFLLQMGGFMLCDGETPLRVLEFDELKKLIVGGKVELPRISEEEINDKSKGDFLTKLFVVLQTSWFIVQCLARWATHLPITELEIVTLGFAVLNIITYGLWWKKPQNVLVAVSVPLKGDMVGEPQPRIDEDESWIRRELGEARKFGWVRWVLVVPWRIFQASLRPVGKLMGYSSYVLPGGSLRVPMFHVDGGDSHIDAKAGPPTLAIAFLFGAIHLIPWSSDFPSTVERWLWRSSALTIMIQPTLMFLQNFSGQYNIYLAKVLVWTAGILIALGVPLYFLARFILLILAFTTLRVLPPGAYENIQWTTVVPHV